MFVIPNCAENKMLVIPNRAESTVRNLLLACAAAAPAKSKIGKDTTSVAPLRIDNSPPLDTASRAEKGYNPKSLIALLRLCEKYPSSRPAS
jgi:hypothetical protein